jgi:hypothetical protein
MNNNNKHSLRVMAAKLTRLTHKIAIQLHLVAESFTICSSRTSALHGGELSVSLPGRFTPKERAPGTRLIGGWVGARPGLDAVVKRKTPNLCRDS